MVGSVTTVRPVLCIGRHDATGTCVDGASADQLAGLAVGDCVQPRVAPSATYSMIGGDATLADGPFRIQ
jgi:hypothetical protein